LSTHPDTYIPTTTTAGSGGGGGSNDSLALVVSAQGLGFRV